MLNTNASDRNNLYRPENALIFQIRSQPPKGNEVHTGAGVIWNLLVCRTQFPKGSLVFLRLWSNRWESKWYQKGPGAVPEIDYTTIL